MGYSTQRDEVRLGSTGQMISAMVADGPVLWPDNHRGPTFTCKWANATAAAIGDVVTVTYASGVRTANYADGTDGPLGVILERTDLTASALTDTYDQYDTVNVRILEPGDVILAVNHPESAALAPGSPLIPASGELIIGTIGTDDIRFVCLDTFASAASATTKRYLRAVFKG